MAAPEEEMEFQEPERKTQAVPPEVEATNVEQGRVDLVDVGSEHVLPALSLPIATGFGYTRPKCVETERSR